MNYRLSRMDRRINTRGNVMVGTIENEKIKFIIRSGIEGFCKEKDIPYRALKEDPDFFKDRLFAYLEENEELRKLCKNPETLRSYLDIVISFF